MQTVTIGSKKGLVFPIMCNGCVKIDYSDNIPDLEGDTLTSTDLPYGIWGNKGSFIFDIILTPYETNGSSSNILDSKKVSPDKSTGTFSQKNISSEMRLFHNSKLKISLIRETSHTQYNNPAIYKIEAKLTTASTTTTLTSDALIFPSVSQPITREEKTGIFNAKGRLTHTVIETLGGSAHGGSTTFTSGTSPASDIYNLGEVLYTKNGFNSVNIGRITNLSGTTVTLSKTPSSLNSQAIYRDAPKEANYVNDFCHIGVSFNSVNNTLNLLYNGKVIKSVQRTETTEFQLDPEDIFLGSNGSNTFNSASASSTNYSDANKQFYGVFHEMSYSRGTDSSFNAGVLSPVHENNLLFLTFEEVDD